MIMIIELKLLYVRRVPLACRARLLLGSRNVPCAATSVLCCWSVARGGVRAPCTCRRALLLVGRVVKLIVNMYNYDVLCCWRLSRAAGAPTRLSGVCRGPEAPVAGNVMMYSVYCCCVASRARGVAASSTLLWESRLSRAWEAAMGGSGGLSRSVAAHAHSVRGGGRRARCRPARCLRRCGLSRAPLTASGASLRVGCRGGWRRARGAVLWQPGTHLLHIGATYLRPLGVFYYYMTKWRNKCSEYYYLYLCSKINLVFS